MPLLRISRSKDSINMRTQQHHCFARVFFALQPRAAATSPPPAPPLVDAAVGWMKINLEKHGSTRADTGFKNEMCVHVPRAREQTRGASLLSRAAKMCARMR